MRVSALLTVLSLLVLPVQVVAAPAATMELGVRGGAEISHSNLEEDYSAAELYFLKALPWGTDLGGQTSLASRFDLGATYLAGAGEKGGMIAAGADLVLGLWDGEVELEIGFRPTWLFDQTFGEDNFGGGMQFTSHAGMAVRWQQVVLNYRIQHTSNAGLYDYNSGLNLHMIGLGWRF